MNIRYSQPSIHCVGENARATINTSDRHYSLGYRHAVFTVLHAFRCLDASLKASEQHPAWDAMAGNGVCTMALLNHPGISEVYASDVDQDAVARLQETAQDTRLHVFRHNVLRAKPRDIANSRLHLAVIDPPYDHNCHWFDDNGVVVQKPDRDLQLAMLELAFINIRPALANGAVMALIHRISITRNHLELLAEAELIAEHRLASGDRQAGWSGDRNLYLLRKDA